MLIKKKTEVSYFKNLKNLFKSKEYLLLLFSMIFTLSVMNCFASFLELYIVPFGLTSVQYITMIRLMQQLQQVSLLLQASLDA